MRARTTLVVASLCLAAASAAIAQNPPVDMFKDQDPMHWAYPAMESLRTKGIVIGYPDQYFRGKRTLTRYEFSVALDRALKQFMPVAGPAGERGPKGEPGERGEAGPRGAAGMTPEEVAALRRLTGEFSDELRFLGQNMGNVNRRIDQLGKDVGEIRGQLDKMPKLWFGAFWGFRSDIANGDYADADGRINPLGSRQAVVHEFHLGVDAKIQGGAALATDLAIGNYQSYLGGNFTTVNSPLGADRPAIVRLDEMAIKTPFGGFGRGGNLTLGRFRYDDENPLSFRKRDTDWYFNNPYVDDGKYHVDGINLNTHVGSVGLGVVAGQLSSAQGTDGGPFNLAWAGGQNGFPLFAQNWRPVGLAYTGQTTVEQFLGLRADSRLPWVKGTTFGLSVYDTENRTLFPGIDFREVWIPGAYFRCHPCNHFWLDGNWAKSITHNGFNDTVNAHQNSAFDVNAKYGVGRWSLGAGYKYVDPLFYTPGDWGRFDNWLNPTNIQGPRGSIGYQFNQNFGMKVGGEFYSSAHNRTNQGGIGPDDELNHYNVDFDWKLSKTFQIDTRWDRYDYKFEGFHSGIPGLGSNSVIHPTSNYYSIGTGYHLTDSLKLGVYYSTGDFDGHSLIGGHTTFGGGSSYGRSSYGGAYGTKYNGSVITTQLYMRY